MRFVFLLLICAIAIGGPVAAAAEPFLEKCAPVQNAQGMEDHASPNLDACGDCVECCVTHAAVLASLMLSGTRVEDRLSFVTGHEIRLSDLSFSLLRPPRSFI